MNKFESVVQQLILNYKYIFTNKVMLFYLLSFLLFPVLLCLIFIPFRFVIPVVFVVGALLPSSMFYISRSYSWKEGSLDQQLKGTKFGGVINNISLLTFFFINLYSLSFLLIIIFHILGISNLLIENWFGGRMHDYNNVIKLFNIGMIYSLFELGIVMYSILFFFMTFVKSHKIMYMLIMTMMVLDIVYGATFNNYFRDIGKLNVDEATGEFESGVVFYSRNLFPDFFYYPTVALFPLYGPSQHIATNKFVIDGYTELQFFNWSNPDDVITYWHSSDSFRVGFDSFRWNVLWLIPYVHIGCLLSTGILINNIKKEA